MPVRCRHEESSGERESAINVWNCVALGVLFLCWALESFLT